VVTLAISLERVDGSSSRVGRDGVEGNGGRRTNWAISALLAVQTSKLKGGVFGMFARLIKIAALICVAVATVGVAQKAQPKAPSDPLNEWAYPKAKRSAPGSNQPPLLWTRFTTTDAFEKVWEFYLRKVTAGLPMGIPSPTTRGGGTFYFGGSSPQEAKVCAQFRDDNPTAKVGVFVIREKERTISVTIFRRAKEKETNIIVAVDQR